MHGVNFIRLSTGSNESQEAHISSQVDNFLAGPRLQLDFIPSRAKALPRMYPQGSTRCKNILQVQHFSPWLERARNGKFWTSMTPLGAQGQSKRDFSQLCSADAARSTIISLCGCCRGRGGHKAGHKWAMLAVCLRDAAFQTDPC